MYKSDTLIRTKLHPPFIRQELVPRPRLLARIAEGLRRPLTLVAAPAGFGKTTLVASAMAGAGMPAAWLSLDKHDNQARRFLTYLVAALHEANPALGNEAAQLLASQQAPPEAILTRLINDLDVAGGEIALVLDDYQFISSQAVYEQAAFLLAHSPSAFHLVIATRSDPPLPLARLRARGQLVELRAADLRFTVSEAAQFLNEVMGLNLGEDAVAALEARTEGWIAGLQMASLAVQAHLATQGREDVEGLIRAFTGAHHFIMDYLLEEVLAREPEAVQAFLLRTSLLSRLSGPLCDAATGASEGQAMLEALQQRNLFVVPLDDERRWFRYHHLFADLLQARLHQSEPDRIASLYARASTWCAGNGQIAEAVDYALAARDFERAADLVARYWGPAINAGDIETVWSWLQVLPEGIVKQRVLLELAYCWALWLMGRIGEIEAHLVDAENRLNEMMATGEFNAGDAAMADLPAHLAVLRSIVASHHHDFEPAITFAERALQLAPENLAAGAELQLRAIVFLALAAAYEGTGDLEKAANAYREVIQRSRLGASATGISVTYRLVRALLFLGRLREAGAACREALAYVEAQDLAHLPAIGILHVTMSEVLVERNDLEATEAHLARGFELGKWSGRLDAKKNAANAHARLRLARNDITGALAVVQEAEAALGAWAPPLARAELLALKARILVRQGAVREAARCIDEAAALAGQGRGMSKAPVDLAALRVRLAQCAPGEVLADLSPALAVAEARGRLGVALELTILRSLVQAGQGELHQATRDLEHALTLAEPEGYVRVFLDEGPPMQALLAQWLAHAEAGPLKTYAVHLLSQFDAEVQVVAALQDETSPPDVLIEPLSPRELEVLHLIALGRTNKEIAQQLFVAPGTVKAHTSGIYRKLDVANRTEAAARARQLGLLPG